jgi:hypothetical protein
MLFMDMQPRQFHAISVFQDQTRLDHETFWTQSEHHVGAGTIFQNFGLATNFPSTPAFDIFTIFSMLSTKFIGSTRAFLLEIQEEKTFTSSYMIDVCIEKARTPTPANHKLPSPPNSAGRNMLDLRYPLIH